MVCFFTPLPDLMEPVRPRVDESVLEWITSEQLKREWFFEQRDGNCRLMASFAERLSGTMPAWRQGLAPIGNGCRVCFGQLFETRSALKIARSFLTQFLPRIGFPQLHPKKSLSDWFIQGLAHGKSAFDTH